MDAWRVVRLGLFWYRTSYCPRCMWMGPTFVLCLTHSRELFPARAAQQPEDK
jgi:hypothetical protein